MAPNRRPAGTPPAQAQAQENRATVSPGAELLAQQREQYQIIERTVAQQRDKIVQTLAKGIDPERFLRVALQAITRQPLLFKCTPASIVKSLRDAAELGLEPSGLLGSAYLVPYWNKNIGAYEAQLIPGYRGLIDLARRSGEIKEIAARVVYERDEFDLNLADSTVLHRPYINRGETVDVLDKDGNKVGEAAVDGGKPIGAYLAGSFISGGRFLEWMTEAEIQAVRKRSKAADNGPWVTDTNEMRRKTVTRRGIKYLPIAIESPVIRALEVEDAAEASGALMAGDSGSAPRLGAAAADRFRGMLGAGTPQAAPEGWSEGVTGPIPAEINNGEPIPEPQPDRVISTGDAGQAVDEPTPEPVQVDVTAIVNPQPTPMVSAPIEREPDPDPSLVDPETGEVDRRPKPAAPAPKAPLRRDEPIVCGVKSPYSEDGKPCFRPSRHDGMHRNEDRETWASEE